jgi:hypothetical protein
MACIISGCLSGYRLFSPTASFFHSLATMIPVPKPTLVALSDQQRKLHPTFAHVIPMSLNYTMPRHLSIMFFVKDNNQNLITQ